jgi:hypothetical protein
VASSSGSKPDGAVPIMILVKVCCDSSGKIICMLTLLKLMPLFYVEHFP